MALYVPNYTSGSSQIRAGVGGDSLSTWCAACHEQYDEHDERVRLRCLRGWWS